MDMSFEEAKGTQEVELWAQIGAEFANSHSADKRIDWEGHCCFLMATLPLPGSSKGKLTIDKFGPSLPNIILKKDSIVGLTVPLTM
jgi:hypothetical protein